TFTSENQLQSGTARLIHWEEAWPTIEENPLFGSGLGTLYDAFRPGRGLFGEADQSAVFDNSYLDIAMRAGLVGSAFFVAAAVLSASRAIRAWRVTPSAVSASVSLACLATILGV